VANGEQEKPVRCSPFAICVFRAHESPEYFRLLMLARPCKPKAGSHVLRGYGTVGGTDHVL
jgi:hypothetical protein